MELDLQSLFGLRAQLYYFWDPATPPPHLGPYTRALFVSRDRGHLSCDPLTLNISLTRIMYEKSNVQWLIRWAFNGDWLSNGHTKTHTVYRSAVSVHEQKKKPEPRVTEVIESDGDTDVSWMHIAHWCLFKDPDFLRLQFLTVFIKTILILIVCDFTHTDTLAAIQLFINFGRKLEPIAAIGIFLCWKSIDISIEKGGGWRGVQVNMFTVYRYLVCHYIHSSSTSAFQ